MRKLKLTIKVPAYHAAVACHLRLANHFTVMSEIVLGIFASAPRFAQFFTTQFGTILIKARVARVHPNECNTNFFMGRLHISLIPLTPPLITGGGTGLFTPKSPLLRGCEDQEFVCDFTLNWYKGDSRIIC
jgi:hypothetical protein